MLNFTAHGMKIRRRHRHIHTNIVSIGSSCKIKSFLCAPEIFFVSSLLSLLSDQCFIALFYFLYLTRFDLGSDFSHQRIFSLL